MLLHFVTAPRKVQNEVPFTSVLKPWDGTTQQPVGNKFYMYLFLYELSKKCHIFKLRCTCKSSTLSLIDEKWLWNVCFCSLFWPWRVQNVINCCLLWTEELTNRSIHNSYIAVSAKQNIMHSHEWEIFVTWLWKRLKSTHTAGVWVFST